MTKKRSRFNENYWSQERVDKGLLRFIQDFHEDRGDKLPASYGGYKLRANVADKGKSYKERRYPPADAVMRYYETFPAAWWKFGYLVEVKVKNPKFVFTEEIDDRLREIYSHRFGAKDRPADLPGPKEYARSLGLPEYLMTHRAQELGLAFTKEPAWSPEELELLEEYGYRTPSVLRKLFKERGFTRTQTSIGLMRKRRAVHKASPYFSMNALSVLFGVDAHVVKKWIDRGWLKFIIKEKQKNPDAKVLCSDTRLIHKDWIFDFVAAYPDSFDIRKVDQLWFLHIITRGEVKLAFSNPDKMTKRTEGQQIEAPIENRISVVKKQNKGMPKGLKSARELAKNKPHGTRIKYLGGCRCPECRNANADYEKSRRTALKNGERNDLVPAESARTHLADLSAQGIGYKTAANAASVAASVVHKIISGERTQIRISTEQKILAVTPDSLAKGAPVDGEETWRQINWLLDNGLTKGKIAAEIGSTAKTPTLQIRKDKVRKSTAEKVKIVYDKYYAEHQRKGNVTAAAAAAAAAPQQV